MEEKVMDEKVMDEKVETRRTFDGVDGIAYFIAEPTADNVRGADWQYSKNYTNSLVEGITTSAEMTDILMRRGIIGTEFEQRANELSMELRSKIEVLEGSDSIDSKRDSSIEVAIAREELFQWNQRLNGPMSNTCEQIADDARLEFLTSCIIQTESAQRVWPDFDSYLGERDKGNLAVQARYEVMLYLQGLNPDFMDQTPEAVAMREVEADIMTKAQEALAAMEELSKVEAKPKKVAKKKTTKKKATAKKTKKE